MEENTEGVLKHAETLVIGNKSDEFANVSERISGDQVVIDLVRICDQKSNGHNYEGICW